MDRLDKALAKLSVKERQRVKIILGKIKASDFVGLNLKKLKGPDNICRVRQGQLRIIYQVGSSGIIKILLIERRNDHTYRDF